MQEGINYWYSWREVIKGIGSSLYQVKILFLITNIVHVMSFTIFIDVAQNTSLYFKFNLNYGILNLFEIERRKKYFTWTNDLEKKQWFFYYFFIIRIQWWFFLKEKNYFLYKNSIMILRYHNDTRWVMLQS